MRSVLSELRVLPTRSEGSECGCYSQATLACEQAERLKSAVPWNCSRHSIYSCSLHYTLQ